MNKLNKYVFFSIILISIITLVIILFPFENGFYNILRIIFWSIFILFLPGYLITLSFFGEKEIDGLERFALSFAFSISVVPLLTFYLNLIWVKITDLNVFFIASLVIVLNMIYIYFKEKKWTEKIS